MGLPLLHRRIPGCAALLSAATLLGCAAPAEPEPALPPVSPLQPELERTEVVLIGTLQGKHHSSETWSLKDLEQTLRNYAPEVVCVELSDDLLEETLERLPLGGDLDDHLLRFPELWQVVLPLQVELDYVLESGALWHPMLEGMRRATLEEFETEPQHAEELARYRAAQQWTRDWLEERGPRPKDDPLYLHGWDQEIDSRARSGPYEEYLNELIGRPMGYRYLHDEHFEKIHNVMRRHRGKRVAVVFQVKALYWFRQRLRWHPDVELLDARDFMPSMHGWPPGAEAFAVAEFHAGVDCLRVWWAQMRGDALFAWDRIEAMLDLPTTEQAALLSCLKAGKSRHVSEFADGPWLDIPRVVAAGADWWTLEVGVRRFGDTPKDRQFLRATLRLDRDRPGGYAWTELKVPAWLLDSGGTLPE